MSENFNKSDISTIIAKGTLGVIPIVGPIIAEIVGATIPNQRIDRIESLLKKLELKLNGFDKDKIENKIKEPESIDLIEDSFIQASRALSEERKEYIAALLKNSLTNDDLNHIEYKRLFSLLGEMNDIEILILISHRFTLYRDDPEAQLFWEKHREILEEPLLFSGASQEEVDKYTLYQTHRTHLVSLGLFKPRFKKPKNGELPEFDDKTGMIKASGYDSTSLGRLLLRMIDQQGKEDF
ncbi:hypothetical protein [Thiothrix nivea]|uniref:DUF4393 domain-containing protein n=1 Tax=Thiothrix nivea (strain ATCC 35100 / DSM 5205 / JP2) TaxID=870187 RepID=A0A656HL09_THINJ|nr:hypothetical protein [Thiothrix nivea]EIJ36973.1 hypothetical protein Thini_4499 [Thiothrix nivea DSM 5205]